jgi:hypothetical protein
MGFLRRAAVNLALVLGGIACAMLIAELVMQLTPLGKTVFYVYDPHLGWKLRAGAHGYQTGEGDAYLRVNRWGYRGPNWTLRKPPGTLRIAVLGDSFTEAQQVAEDQTFCAVTQRELAHCPALRGGTPRFERVEVLNFGCDSYGTAQELITLKRRVWKFAPDFVVLAVFTGNDIRNNSVVLEGDKCRPFFVDRGGQLAPAGPFDDSFWFHAGCMMRFESRHSQVLNMLGSVRSEIRAWLRRRRAREHAPAKPALVEPGINSLIYRPPDDPTWKRAWQVTDGEIEAIHRDAASHGAGFLVVTLSNPPQDNPDAVARRAYEQWLGVSDLFYPGRRISELGRNDGFAVLNLAPPMQQYADTHRAYLHGFANTRPGWGHWNALGHRVAGELIAQKICAMLGQGVFGRLAKLSRREGRPSER